MANEEKNQGTMTEEERRKKQQGNQGNTGQNRSRSDSLDDDEM